MFGSVASLFQIGNDIYLGPPSSRPSLILWAQTSPHRWNSHLVSSEKNPSQNITRVLASQKNLLHHSSHFAGPFLSLATPLPSSPLSLILAHLLHMHVFCLPLPTSSSTNPLEGVLAQADCPGWQGLQRGVWGNAELWSLSPYVAAGLSWSW